MGSKSTGLQIINKGTGQFWNGCYAYVGALGNKYPFNKNKQGTVIGSRFKKKEWIEFIFETIREPLFIPKQIKTFKIFCRFVSSYSFKLCFIFSYISVEEHSSGIFKVLGSTP